MQAPQQALLPSTHSASVLDVYRIVNLAEDIRLPVDSFLNPTASPWAVSLAKRSLDLMGALIALAILALPMIAIALLVRFTSSGPALFIQERVGKGGHLFKMMKFRSMTYRKDTGSGPGLTRTGDHRITPVGRWLRRLKLDELPQLINVLRGDMSMVGPRPKLPRYAALWDMPYRPGVTGAATLAFRREEEILGQFDPAELDACYERSIKPLKARVDVRYMCRATCWSDLRLIAATLLACIWPGITHRVIHFEESMKIARLRLD